MAIHESAAKGFSAGADAYERGRPDYAPEAVATLVRELRIGPGTRVLDLAAGTGKLTRQLVDTGAEITAVEPVAEMRAKLVAAVPGVEALEGTAERIPLANHSVDAVVVGQAFHWFDGVRALSAIHRVLRPTGGLGLVWQSRDATLPWVKRLNEMIDGEARGQPRFRQTWNLVRAGVDSAWRAAFDLTALFAPIETATFAHVQRGTVETIVDRVASISFIAAMPDERRAVVLDAVRELLATDRDTSGAEVIELPYSAEVFWTRPSAIPAGPSTGVVVAVNVSRGGVPKLPVAGTRIRTLGLDGDSHTDTRNHGGHLQAVCLYSVESIERVASEGHTAFPGAYGENLTLAGIDWNGLRTGDRLRLGSDGPLLQLTDDATPCAKQAQWFIEGDISRISIRRYPEDARWYASVVEEGTVAPGDRVELIRTA
jgi:MOSC domain-containing protein YiiM/SAM-dependent methyltransferase